MKVAKKIAEELLLSFKLDLITQDDILFLSKLFINDLKCSYNNKEINLGKVENTQVFQELIHTIRASEYKSIIHGRALSLLKEISTDMNTSELGDLMESLAECYISSYDKKSLLGLITKNLNKLEIQRKDNQSYKSYISTFIGKCSDKLHKLYFKDLNFSGLMERKVKFKISVKHKDDKGKAGDKSSEIESDSNTPFFIFMNTLAIENKINVSNCKVIYKKGKNEFEIFPDQLLYMSISEAFRNESAGQETPQTTPEGKMSEVLPEIILEENHTRQELYFKEKKKEYKDEIKKIVENFFEFLNDVLTESDFLPFIRDSKFLEYKSSLFTSDKIKKEKIKNLILKKKEDPYFLDCIIDCPFDLNNAQRYQLKTEIIIYIYFFLKERNSQGSEKGCQTSKYVLDSQKSNASGTQERRLAKNASNLNLIRRPQKRILNFLPKDRDKGDFIIPEKSDSFELNYYLSIIAIMKYIHGAERILKNIIPKYEEFKEIIEKINKKEIKNLKNLDYYLVSENMPANDDRDKIFKLELDFIKFSIFKEKKMSASIRDNFLKIQFFFEKMDKNEIEDFFFIAFNKCCDNPFSEEPQDEEAIESLAAAILKKKSFSNDNKIFWTNSLEKALDLCKKNKFQKAYALFLILFLKLYYEDLPEEFQFDIPTENSPLLELANAYKKIRRKEIRFKSFEEKFKSEFPWPNQTSRLVLSMLYAISTDKMSEEEKPKPPEEKPKINNILYIFDYLTKVKNKEEIKKELKEVLNKDEFPDNLVNFLKGINKEFKDYKIYIDGIKDEDEDEGIDKIRKENRVLVYDQPNIPQFLLVDWDLQKDEDPQEYIQIENDNIYHFVLCGGANLKYSFVIYHDQVEMHKDQLLLNEFKKNQNNQHRYIYLLYKKQKIERTFAKDEFNKIISQTTFETEYSFIVESLILTSQSTTPKEIPKTNPEENSKKEVKFEVFGFLKKIRHQFATQGLKNLVLLGDINNSRMFTSLDKRNLVLFVFENNKIGVYETKSNKCYFLEFLQLKRGFSKIKVLKINFIFVGEDESLLLSCTIGLFKVENFEKNNFIPKEILPGFFERAIQLSDGRILILGSHSCAFICNIYNGNGEGKVVLETKVKTFFEPKEKNYIAFFCEEKIYFLEKKNLAILKKIEINFSFSSNNVCELEEFFAIFGLENNCSTVFLINKETCLLEKIIPVSIGGINRIICKLNSDSLLFSINNDFFGFTILDGKNEKIDCFKFKCLCKTELYFFRGFLFVSDKSGKTSIYSYR